MDAFLFEFVLLLCWLILVARLVVLSWGFSFGFSSVSVVCVVGVVGCCGGVWYYFVSDGCGGWVYICDVCNSWLVVLGYYFSGVVVLG